jgi:phage baseplate assembly protein W
MADHWRIKQSQSNMNVNTGKTISEIAHIKQSIANILSTPIGSRVMRRDYGSRLFERIDQPINGELIAEIYSDIVEAISTWEPRFEVEQVTLQSIDKGKIVIDLEGSFVKDGQKIVLENISITSS